MRQHEKNIGKTVYVVCKGYTQGFSKNEVYEGMLVNVGKDDVKIYIEKLDKVKTLRKYEFNNTGNRRWSDFSWGYATKNLYKFIKTHENRLNKLYSNNHKHQTISSSTIVKLFQDGNVPYDYLKIDNTNKNKYLHRYQKDLERFFNFFSQERHFKVRHNGSRYSEYHNTFHFEKNIDFMITKFYNDDETIPFKIRIEFVHHDGYTRIKKFDNVVTTLKLVEGEKYNN